MRVALISEIPTPYRDPVLERISRLDNSQLNVFYCAATESGRGWTLAEKTYPYEILPGISFNVSKSNPQTVKINFGLWKKLSAGNFDAVIVASYTQPTMISAMTWCRFHKIPYILWSESHHLTPRPFWKEWLKKPLLRFAISGASAFLALGSNARDYLLSYGVEPSRIFLFPNAPDVDRLIQESSRYQSHKKELRVQLGLSTSLLILYVGRLIGVKNLDTLIKAFPQVQQAIPGAGLVFAGDGPLRASLENTARALGLNNVYFTGFIQPQDTVKYYAAADVLVLPSLSETWGATVLEGMACGLPVAVSDRVGCARDLVQEKQTGFVVPVNDVAQWANVLTRLGRDEALRVTMGNESQKLAQQWDYHFCTAQFQACMKKAFATLSLRTQ